MPVIITLIIAMFLILISWTWHNLSGIDKTKKILTIVISLIVVFIITFIQFNISKEGVQYKTQDEMGAVRVVLVILFTAINGLIVMPAISRVLGKINDESIKKDQAQKRFILIIVIFIVILFFECNYMKSVQQEILNIYNSALHK